MKTIKFCKGCGHTPIAKEVEKVLMVTNGIFVGSVGCSVSLPTEFIEVDAISSAHGRALAVATGIRRVIGDERPIVTIQGDGDLGNIGMLEFKATCYRNEKIVCVLINNQNYGMTGGQMASTTELGVKTKTCIDGRMEKWHGIPVNMKYEAMCNPKVHYYITTSATREGIEKFKEYLNEAIKYDGFSLIEVISPCVIFWGNAKKAYDYAKEVFERMK